MEKIKLGIKKYLVDSTAILTVTTPFFAAFETFIAGMSNENSFNARLLATGLTYAGMGRLFTKGMDLSRKAFKIKPETSEKMKHLHDASYAAAYNLLIGPAFYYAAGVRDLKQIAVGTGMSVGLALIAGGPMGYAVDAFRDLTGLESSQRLPKAISNQSSKVKKSLVAIALATSIGLTSGVYHINKYYGDSSQTPNKPEISAYIRK